MTCRERILSNDYVDLLARFEVSSDFVQEDYTDYCIKPIGDMFNAIYANRATYEENQISARYYSFVPHLFGLMQLEGDGREEAFDPLSLSASGILQVQNPPLELTGRGVVYAFIDTGIEYTNPVFRNTAGNTRILSIWDQTIQTGTPPQGMEYGTEYTREQINEALADDNPLSVVPSTDELGHGTELASVGAGSRLENGRAFRGAAPDTDIVVVKLKECKPFFRDFYLIPEDVPAYSEIDIMMAVKYAASFVETFRRPVVICLGVGSNSGGHTGSTPLSVYLADVAGSQNCVVVVNGGNEGNSAHHFAGRVPQSQNGEETGVDVEIRVGDGERGFLMEVWGSTPNIFYASIRSPGGEVVPRFQLGIGRSVDYSFVYERTRVTIDSELVVTSSGDELILFRFRNPTPGIWTVRIFSSGTVYSGEFHAWLPITKFLSSQTYFVRPDPYITLTEPAYSQAVITTSTYNDINNSFFLESGRGFSRDGRVKPDLSAPGVNVSTIYGKRTGACLGAALAAGGAAQYMEWAVIRGNNAMASGMEVRNYFIRGAARENNIDYPSREWGFGRLNMSGVFDVLASI